VKLWLAAASLSKEHDGQAPYNFSPWLVVHQIETTTTIPNNSRKVLVFPHQITPVPCNHLKSIFVSLESSDSFILLPSLNAVVMSQVSREGTEGDLDRAPSCACNFNNIFSRAAV
jgi:hypothetical protein